MFAFLKKLLGISSIYSLKKSKTTLRQVYHAYMKHRKNLSSLQKEELKTTLIALQAEVLGHHRKKAHQLAKEAESLAHLYLKKSSFRSFRDFVFALAFALVVAILIRQMWFEFYEIPTGSMRPTLKEQDRLVVSKTDFGINTPLQVNHLYFDPGLTKRNGIFIFTVENMDVDDADTVYFYLFPGKKQYIKRLIGKPGDTLYFYGGRVYGIDQDGNDISNQLQIAELESIDHIPFIHFEGKAAVAENPQSKNGIHTTAVLYQMNEPIAKLSVASNHQIEGEMFPLNAIRDTAMPPIQNYEDLWGIKNFATARLLTKDEVKQLTHYTASDIDPGLLYLELKHHPSLRSLKLGRDLYGRLRPMFHLSTAIIPLSEAHLRVLFNNLYTARFVVKNGFAHRYGSQQNKAINAHFQPHLPGVPDGTYEFYNGKAYEIKWQGITSELPASHPIYLFTPERIQIFFNLGIEVDNRFAPGVGNRQLDTSRYAYYRNGDLYLMNAPILKKDDPSLVSFLAKEAEKESVATSQNPYTPFKDFGPPLRADGTLDKDIIRQFGLKIPQKMYLALGDNYAMSADSRVFGFVPQNNIRGGPSMIFWPPGSRWGAPNQPSYPFINLPCAVVWSLATLCIGSWAVIHYKRNKLPLKNL